MFYPSLFRTCLILACVSPVSSLVAAPLVLSNAQLAQPQDRLDYVDPYHPQPWLGIAAASTLLLDNDRSQSGTTNLVGSVESLFTASLSSQTSLSVGYDYETESHDGIFSSTVLNIEGEQWHLA